MLRALTRRCARLPAALLAILFLPSCTEMFDAAPLPAEEPRTLTHQGVERHFLLRNVEAAAAGPAPLVVSLHGYRGVEQALAERKDLSGIAWKELDRMADREGFVIAYPHAWLGRWSMFEGLENARLEDGRMVDDAGFVAVLVSHLVDEGVADAERVYLTGFSDGAIMTYRLLCTPGMPFAAAAPGGGSMYEPHRDDCAADAPLPIMVIAGTYDAILPYDGWLFDTGRAISIPETMEHFRLLNGCTGQKGRLLDDRHMWDNSRVLEMYWTGCAVENSVKLLKVKGGGHNWPSYGSIPDEWRRWAGTHNRDIESAEEIWKFVSRFRKSRSRAHPSGTS